MDEALREVGNADEAAVARRGTFGGERSKWAAVSLSGLHGHLHDGENPAASKTCLRCAQGLPEAVAPRASG